MEDKLFTLLGLGVPFYLGAATYAVFAWLDNNASDEATQVIASWLKGRSQRKFDLGNLVIDTFDRIYTSPLLTFNAFRRSAAISSIIWLSLIFVPGFVDDFQHIVRALYQAHDKLIAVVLIDYCLNWLIIVSTDYISLFFVRQFLEAARMHPMYASITSSLIGSLVVAINFFLFISVVAAFVAYLPGEEIRLRLDKLFIAFPHLMAPAFIIHLWLPLFALSSLVVKLVFWIFRAVEWAQWFLKQGDAHPLKAIGIVATIIVFGSAMLVKEGWALLNVLERS